MITPPSPAEPSWSSLDVAGSPITFLWAEHTVLCWSRLTSYQGSLHSTIDKLSARNFLTWFHQIKCSETDLESHWHNFFLAEKNQSYQMKLSAVIKPVGRNQSGGSSSFEKHKILLYSIYNILFLCFPVFLLWQVSTLGRVWVLGAQFMDTAQGKRFEDIVSAQLHMTLNTSICGCRLRFILEIIKSCFEWDHNVAARIWTFTSKLSSRWNWPLWSRC